MYSAFGVDHGSELEKRSKPLSAKAPVDDALAAKRRIASAKSGLFGDQRASAAYDNKLLANDQMRRMSR